MEILIRTLSWPYKAPITGSGNGTTINYNVKTIIYNSGHGEGGAWAGVYVNGTGTVGRGGGIHRTSENKSLHIQLSWRLNAPTGRQLR